MSKLLPLLLCLSLLVTGCTSQEPFVGTFDMSGVDIISEVTYGEFITYAGNITDEWSNGPLEVVRVGDNVSDYKVHRVTLGAWNKIGTNVSVGLYTPVAGVEAEVYIDVADNTTWVMPTQYGLVHGYMIMKYRDWAVGPYEISYDIVLEKLQ